MPSISSSAVLKASQATNQQESGAALRAKGRSSALIPLACVPRRKRYAGRPCPQCMFSYIASTGAPISRQVCPAPEPGPSINSAAALRASHTTIRQEAGAALRAKGFGCRALPGWPATSPDLNPQENVWSWAEDELRRKEKASDTLDTFTRRVLDVTKRYPSGSKLIPSMAKRVAKCIQKRGAPIGT